MTEMTLKEASEWVSWWWFNAVSATEAIFTARLKEANVCNQVASPYTEPVGWLKTIFGITIINILVLGNVLCSIKRKIIKTILIPVRLQRHHWQETKSF